jgi:cytochrome oxidase Cu insertion factor (SCO1/SenC/PrrC family)
MNLQEELDKVKADLGAKIPPEIMELLGKSQQEIEATGIVGLAPKVGDKAIDFTLPNQDGKQISLSGLLSQGPVVVTFFRGKW